jgi:uncharacterized coiled-coil protein SlyX
MNILDIVNKALDAEVAAQVATATATLQSKVTTQATEITALKSTVTARNATIATLETENAALKAEIQRLKDGTGVPTNPTPPPDEEEPPTPRDGEPFLISEAEVKARPMSGDGWDTLKAFATRTWHAPDLSDLNGQGDSEVVAGALYYVRTGDAAMKAKVIAQLRALFNTKWDRTLEAARGVQGYIIAADLIGYAAPDFVAFIEDTMERELASNSHSGLRTLLLLARYLWNNWSMHGRAAVLLAGLYLKRYGNTAQKAKGQAWIDQVLKTHKHLLGLRVDNPDAIVFPDKTVEWLQGDPIAAVVVKGTTVEKFGKTINISGVLPLDRLRGSYDIQWPPVKTGYNAEGAQGLVTTAVLLHRQGLLSFTAADNAMARVAYAQYGMGEAATNEPVHVEPFVGDDAWLPYYINHYAELEGDARVPEGDDNSPGKGGIGHGQWLFGQETS